MARFELAFPVDEPRLGGRDARTGMNDLALRQERAGELPDDERRGAGRR
jgi:hypothetical protein